MEEIRKIIREEIARAANIWREEVAPYEIGLISRDGNCCYGTRPATTDEKFDLFLRLLEETKNEETL
jgi:hypothetical protein